MNAFRWQVQQYAAENGMPIDFLHGQVVDANGKEFNAAEGKVSNTDGKSTAASSVSSITIVNGKQHAALSTGQQCDDDDEYTSVATNDINYHAIVLRGNIMRQQLEESAREGQKKQAEAVNKTRIGVGGEVLRKWTVATLVMPHDKNEFTPKNLPVLICGTIYYKTTDTYRYR